MTLHAVAGDFSAFTLAIVDSGAVITPGTSCTARNPHVVDCSGTRFLGTAIDLGDLNDAISTTGGPASTGITGYPIRGGDGNDRLKAAPHDGERGFGLIHVGFDGGPGNDALVGVDGDDLLFGGPGDDVIKGNAGKDGLSGGEGADRLDGGGGGDRLDGRGGNDRLFVAGADLAAGGPGDDSFILAGSEPASIVCHVGRDSILGDLRAPPSRAGPWFSRTCEGFLGLGLRRTRFGVRSAYPVSATHAGTLTFHLPCLRAFGPCRGVLVLSAGGRPFREAGRARFTIRRSQNISVRVARRVARAARRRPVRLRARLSIPSQFGRLP